MKQLNFRWIVLITIIGLFSTSCEEENNDSKVEENGLTSEINNLVPPSVLTEMEDLGMPINTGENPPNIENSYFASPFVLVNSNRPTDNIGHTFSDFYVKFYQQDNENLEVLIDYMNGPETGNGVGGFIVGSDNAFTVFAEMNIDLYGDTAIAAMVFSGKITDGGINDFYYANFMIENNGNPNGYFIEEGDGRIIYDSDGFSEETNIFKSLTKSSNPEYSVSSTLSK